MKRLLSIGALLLALAARCDTEIYVNVSDLTWTGSGTEYWAAWTVADADRTDFGAWMHLDASLASSLDLEPANGTNFVYQWSDWRGNGLYARQDGTYPGIPFVISSAQNGKSAVCFRPYTTVENSQVGANLKFSAERSDIYAMFGVLSKLDSADYAPVLGGTTTFDFHGTTGGGLYGSAVSARVYQGTNAMDGVRYIWPDNIFATNAYHVVSIRTYGGPCTADNIGRDRSYRFGGIDFAELLIFTNPVSDAATSEIEAYLKAKWATP